MSLTVDYEETDSSDPKKRATRKARSDFYNSRHLVPAQEPPVGVEPLPAIDHSINRLSAIPAGKSDAIVLGTVADSHAHMSSDRTGVYSEFEVRIDEVIKHDGRSLLVPTKLIAATREGGWVRYPSGRVQRFSILHQGLPKTGARYVLFLKRADETQGFHILTGYEIRLGKIYPLDGEDIEEKQNNLPFASFKGADVAGLMDKVRKAVAEAFNNPPVEGGAATMNGCRGRRRVRMTPSSYSTATPTA